jgi:hypothetical protein
MAELRTAFESRYGRLESGASQLTIGGETLALTKVMRRLGLDFDGNRVIDAPEVAAGRHAIRYFDGEERRIVCLEFRADFSILEEHRVHIAEWLGDAYFETVWEVNCPMDL